jgi:hypothetical protein
MLPLLGLFPSRSPRADLRDDAERASRGRGGVVAAEAAMPPLGGRLSPTDRLLAKEEEEVEGTVPPLDDVDGPRPACLPDDELRLGDLEEGLDVALLPAWLPLPFLSSPTAPLEPPPRTGLLPSTSARLLLDAWLAELELDRRLMGLWLVRLDDLDLGLASLVWDLVLASAPALPPLPALPPRRRSMSFRCRSDSCIPARARRSSPLPLDLPPPSPEAARPLLRP